MKKTLFNTANTFDRFVKSQSFSGVLLMLCTIIALVWSNTSHAHIYFLINELPVTFGIGSATLTKSLELWVNDGLMAVFFLLVGSEIKRELFYGELSSVKKAVLPIVAAIGGMLVPAVLYVVINWHQPHKMAGWAIPAATDLAFALGVLSLLGSRVPRSLFVFLSAAAIVDDLGAIIIIAVFYSHGLHLDYLYAAGGFFVLLIVFNMLGVRKLSPYLLVGAVLWFMLLKSGIHATIAGILLAVTIPCKSYYKPERLIQKLRNLVSEFGHVKSAHPDDFPDVKRQDLLQSVEDLVHEVETPIQRLEHALTPWVTYFIIPLFVLFNAGVSFTGINVHSAMTSTIVLGIIAGLVLGKPLGIFGFTWIAVKLKWVELPKSLPLKAILPLSFLAGIGFTMSIFITELAFPGNTHLLTMAKLGIFVASFIAGVVGFVWLRMVLKKP
jgi:NhaA family Na+:H+ antiporter